MNELVRLIPIKNTTGASIATHCPRTGLLKIACSCLVCQNRFSVPDYFTELVNKEASR